MLGSFHAQKPMSDSGDGGHRLGEGQGHCGADLRILQPRQTPHGSVVWVYNIKNTHKIIQKKVFEGLRNLVGKAKLMKGALQIDILTTIREEGSVRVGH